jgi:hypothetical protein
MVFVLGCVMLITLMAVSAVAINRTRVRTVGASNAGVQASASAAQHAELAVMLLQADPNGFAWRDGESFSVLESSDASRPIVEVSDPIDAKLRSGTNAQVRVRASGYKGDAARTLEFDLVAEQRALPVLSHALVVTGSRLFTVLRSLEGTDYFGTHYHPGDVTWTASSPFVVGGMNGEIVPGPEVVDLWASMGTRIDIDVIPGRNVESRLFAPGINPYGTGNARGIYVIDCENKSLSFNRSRVYGTLVLINVGSSCTISDASFESIEGQPALLARGNITMNFGADDISEASVARNLNPVGAPYLGATDNDLNDLYPAGIRGLAYVNGNVAMSSSHIHGTLIIDGNLTGIGYVRAVWAPQPALIEGFTDTRAWRLLPQSMRAVSN